MAQARWPWVIRYSLRMNGATDLPYLFFNFSGRNLYALTILRHPGLPHLHAILKPTQSTSVE